MAKYITLKDLRERHAELRKAVNLISRETAKVRKFAEKTRAEVERLYANVMNVGKQDKLNAISLETRTRVEVFAKPIKERVAPLLRQMEGARIAIEDARDNMTNPVRRINAMTALDRQLAERRVAAMQLVQWAGPAELEVIADAAKGEGDVATLAAVISRNNSLPAKDRRFTNAELLEGVKLPGQNEIDAIYQEAVSLPQYAVHCSRAIEKGGDVKAADRIERGLAERKVEVEEDGTLKGFDAVPRYRADFKPVDTTKTDDQTVDPKQFDTFDEFLAAGGKATDDFDNDDMRRWWPIAEGGA